MLGLARLVVYWIFIVEHDAFLFETNFYSEWFVNHFIYWSGCRRRHIGHLNVRAGTKEKSHFNIVSIQFDLFHSYRYGKFNGIFLIINIHLYRQSNSRVIVTKNEGSFCLSQILHFYFRQKLARAFVVISLQPDNLTKKLWRTNSKAWATQWTLFSSHHFWHFIAHAITFSSIFSVLNATHTNSSTFFI